MTVKPLRPKAPKNRSARSNGTKLFLGEVDGRSPLARRFADLVFDLEAERGGPDFMGGVQRQAVRAYATLIVQRETMETEMAAGRTFNAELYGQLCDRADRQSRRMGPVKAPEKPDLRSHIAAQRAARGKA